MQAWLKMLFFAALASTFMLSASAATVNVSQDLPVVDLGYQLHRAITLNVSPLRPPVK
jgi:hypothetical protein